MDTRKAMFVVQIAWLLVLGGLAAAFLSNAISLKDTLGPIPIGVVWFGALGAVLISLTGIVDHADDWKSSFVLWHLSRPLMGASLAVVSVLIMQAGILAVGSAPAAGQTAAPKNILYYLVAFLVGYREETFRELIKRFVDLVLAPAATAPKGTAVATANQAAATANQAAAMGNQTAGGTVGKSTATPQAMAGADKLKPADAGTDATPH